MTSIFKAFNLTLPSSESLLQTLSASINSLPPAVQSSLAKAGLTSTTSSGGNILAAPLLFAFVILASVGIVGARQSRSLTGGGSMEYTVQWNRERIRLQLPSPDTPLSVIRQEIAEHTHLDPGSFKLVYTGAVMKDDSLPISAYKLRPGCTIAVIGSSSSAPPPPQHKEPPPPRTEASTITAIRNELDKVRGGLAPDVGRLTASLQHHSAAESTLTPAPTSTTTAAPPTSAPTQTSSSALRAPTPAQKTEHTRLGEMLLQSLLRLDAITPESDWAEARKERKAAVKEVQALLDGLDETWTQATKSGGAKI